MYFPLIVSSLKARTMFILLTSIFHGERRFMVYKVGTAKYRLNEKITEQIFKSRIEYVVFPRLSDQGTLPF